MPADVSRRTYSRVALTTAAGAALGLRTVLGTNEQVRLGFIGVGNRGCQLLRESLAHQDARVVAPCDVYEPYEHAADDRADPRFANLDRHARPLARPSDDRGLPGGQGRVR